jgi:hypothetical protein
MVHPFEWFALGRNFSLTGASAERKQLVQAYFGESDSISRNRRAGTRIDALFTAGGSPPDRYR